MSVQRIPEFGLGVRRASLMPAGRPRGEFSAANHTGKYLGALSYSPYLPSTRTDLPSLLPVFAHSGKMLCRSPSGRNAWLSKDFCSRWGLPFSAIRLATHATVPAMRAAAIRRAILALIR